MERGVQESGGFPGKGLNAQANTDTAAHTYCSQSLSEIPSESRMQDPAENCPVHFVLRLPFSKLYYLFLYTNWAEHSIMFAFRIIIFANEAIGYIIKKMSDSMFVS